MAVYSPAIPDVLFYILAAALLLGGVAGVLYAFFGDRHRKTPLCRKCHYNMHGHTNLTCPECGHVHAKESNLFKPRRHPKLAMLGVFVMLLAMVSVYYPQVRWRQTFLNEPAMTAWLPTSWHLIAWNFDSSQAPVVLANRVNWRWYIASSKQAHLALGTQPFEQDALYSWQQALAHRVAWSQLTQTPSSNTTQNVFPEDSFAIRLLLDTQDQDVDIPMLQALITLMHTHSDPSVRWAVLSYLQSQEKHTQAITDALVQVVQDTDPQNLTAGQTSGYTPGFAKFFREAAMQALQTRSDQSAITAQSLVTMLPKYNPVRRPHDVTDLEREICQTLIDIGPEAIPALVKALADEERQGGAVYVIDQIAPNNADAAPVLVRQYTLYDDQIAGPYIAHHAQVIGRMGEAATPAMVEALLDPDPWVRHSAIEALREIYKPDDDELWRKFAELRPDPRSDTAWTAISALWELADREKDQDIRERAEFVARELTIWRQDVYRLTG